MAGPFSNLPELPEWLKPQATPDITPVADALLRAREAATSSPSYPAQPPEKCFALRLQDCVTSGRKLLESKTKTKDPFVMWMRRVRSALVSAFGKDSPVVQNVEMILKNVERQGMSLDQLVQHLAQVDALSDHFNRIAGLPLACPVSQTSRIPATRDVFIIHGHDELNTRRLSQLLQDHFKLNPIAMLAKPGRSRPLSEKFEDEAQTCSFAFALFTPDDEVVNSAETCFQARPNVIYEVGWFIGRLGRPRACLILKSGTKIHSDLDGVSRIHFTENIEEKFIDIQNELRAAQLIS
jgi:predicted nucleotide-binding protein